MRSTLAQVAGLVVLATLLTYAPLSFAQPSTGERQTYLIELEPGVNLVSLPVVPDVTAMSAIVSGMGPEVSLIQDDRGRHTIPSLEIDDIGAWKWSEAYKVHTTAATSLLVEGVAIIPDLSPLILDGGAHWIPYPRSTALAIEEALATILPSLSRVEDEEGRIYEPGNQGSTLDTLRVGRGYRVWLTRQDTLRYPINQNVGGGSTVQVGTLAQARALRDLEPGQEVEILGYYTPGDGGGGRFIVENSGAPTDGGLVHVPDEFVSNPITEVIDNDHDRSKPLSLPPGARLIHGSVTIEILRPNGNVLGTMDGRYLHGHEWVSRFTATPLIDYELGEIDDRHERLNQWCRDEIGDMWACDLRVTYRHTTGNVRLRRMEVGETLNANWFGARTRSADPSFDNQPVLGHVINLANQFNREVPGTITTVLLPSPGEYEYFGSLQIGRGLTLKGGAGTELRTVTNDLGHTYQPVRIKQNATRLRLKADEALTHIRMEKDPSDPDYLPPDLKYRLHGRRPAISVAPGAMAAGLSDIVLDGNWEENRQAWQEGWSSYQEREAAMRNTPSWSGFVSTDHNAVDIPIGQLLTLRNVAVLGYGATGLLGSVNNTWDGENVLLGNSLWNHALYGTNGMWRNLTFTGFSWSHGPFYAGEINNLVFEDGVPGPYRPADHVMGIRGGDVYSEAEMDNPNDPDEAAYIRSDGTVIDLGVTIDGFYIDLRGSGLISPLGGHGPRIRIKNGRVVMDDIASEAAFREKGNGYQKALYPDYEFENITVYDNGERRQWLFRNLYVTNSTFRNISTNSSLIGINEDANRAFDLHASWRNHFAWENPQTVTFTEIFSDSPQKYIGHAETHPNAAGVTYTITRSRFNNTTNTLIVNDNGTGELNQFDGDVSKLNVLMDDVEFNIHDGYFKNLELFFAVTRLRNCTDSRSGRTSEDGAPVTIIASGGETSIDIPTNLLWEPLAPNYTVITEENGTSGLYASHEYVSPDGTPLDIDRRGPSLRIHLTRPLAVNEQVTFDWRAAVRPWLGEQNN